MTPILVHSIDKYHYMAEECVTSTVKELGSSITDFPVYHASESLEVKNVHNIKTGEGSWSKRLRAALDQIPGDHVLYMLQDFIPKYINIELLHMAADYHSQVDNDITKLGLSEFFNVTRQLLPFGRTGYYIYSQTTGPYLISHQPIGIWRKSFLYNTLEGDITAAQHEMINILCTVECVDYRNPQINSDPHKDFGTIIEYHHALFQGRKIEYRGKYV